MKIKSFNTLYTLRSSLEKPKPSKASKLKKPEKLEKQCKVLPPNCNENKFRFEKCTNDNKFIWKPGDKCRSITTQDERWRWRAIQLWLKQLLIAWLVLLDQLN